MASTTARCRHTVVISRGFHRRTLLPRKQQSRDTLRSLPSGSEAVISSRSRRTLFSGRTRIAADIFPDCISPTREARNLPRPRTSIRYRTAFPGASCAENAIVTTYEPGRPRSLAALARETATDGGESSRSATPVQLLRNVMDSWSLRSPPVRVLRNVPRPRSFEYSPVPETIRQAPVPPCSLSIETTSAVALPLPSAHVRSRVPSASAGVFPRTAKRCRAPGRTERARGRELSDVPKPDRGVPSGLVPSLEHELERARRRGASVRADCAGRDHRDHCHGKDEQSVLRALQLLSLGAETWMARPSADWSGGGESVERAIASIRDGVPRPRATRGA